MVDFERRELMLKPSTLNALESILNSGIVSLYRLIQIHVHLHTCPFLLSFLSRKDSQVY